jgi:hypothetical protein
MINRINGKRLFHCTVEELNEAYVGKKFNMLTITGITRELKRSDGKYTSVASYICDCGNIGKTILSNILNGTSKSCGCLKKETYKYANLRSRESGILNRRNNEYYINPDGTVNVVASNDHNIIFTVDLYTWIWFSNLLWSIDIQGYMTTCLDKFSYRYHTLLLPVPPKTKYVRDHKNKSKLDNRYCNLRVVTSSTNNCNKNKKDNCTTNIRGVYMTPIGKYVAMLNSSKYGVRLTKHFDTLEEAVAQRKAWEDQYQQVEELKVPPFIFPNGQLNVYNFPFSWYSDKYFYIWSMLGLRIPPYPYGYGERIGFVHDLYQAHIQ